MSESVNLSLELYLQKKQAAERVGNFLYMYFPFFFQVAKTIYDVKRSPTRAMYIFYYMFVNNNNKGNRNQLYSAKQEKKLLDLTL